MNLNYLAIDIGGTNLKYGVIDHSGILIEKHSEPTETTSLSAFLEQLTRIVTHYTDQIKGVGISVPGKVDHKDDTIYGGGALRFLDQVNLPKLLNSQVPISVENDGKSAALAELWLGNLKAVQNGAAVVLGTGVGGGLIFNGQLYAGSHFQAGELSFMSVGQNLNNEDNWIGRRGSAVLMIERIATEIGLSNKYDGYAVFEAINQRHEVAWPIFEAYANEIAHLIYNVQAIVDVDRVVIGGGISAQKIVTTTIQQAYDKLFHSNEIVTSVLTSVEILPSKFANDANLYGAIYHLLMTINKEV
ncbi:ROK family protein [Leuconostoc sp. MS02]|uniref:ROK family protein n=1 Tax=Leuconostoc aquikimchii TaxID=3236804 RepID=A0ABV3S0N0_9LACO